MLAPDGVVGTTGRESDVVFRATAVEVPSTVVVPPQAPVAGVQATLHWLTVTLRPRVASVVSTLFTESASDNLRS